MLISCVNLFVISIQPTPPPYRLAYATSAETASASAVFTGTAVSIGPTRRWASCKVLTVGNLSAWEKSVLQTPHGADFAAVLEQLPANARASRICWPPGALQIGKVCRFVAVPTDVPEEAGPRWQLRPISDKVRPLSLLTKCFPLWI